MVSTCRRGSFFAGVRLYLQEFTLEVHEIGFPVGQLLEDLIMILHYRGALLISGMQTAFGAYTLLDNEWSKKCFTLIRMVWDLGIKGFIYVGVVQ